MKILLVVCLLVSANAAPAERSRRNILPGDPRYDPTGHHHHHEEHEHHANEIETSKALQSHFGGSFPVPDTTYGVVGSTTGAPLDFSDYFKYDFGTDFSGFNPEIVNIGGAKLVEQSNSVTESSVAPPKVVSVSFVGSSRVSEATTPASIESVTPQDKEEENPAKAEVEEIEVETKSASDATPSDISPSEKPVTVEPKSAVAPGGASFSSDGLSTPFESNFNFGSSIDSSFGSSIGQPSFGSGFESFDQSSFNPGFQSGINRNYEFFGNGGVNYPTSFGTFSGFEQLPQRPIIDSQVSASFPQYTPVELNKNIGYLPPFQGGFSVVPETVTASPFPSLLSVTEAPTNFNFGSQQAYLTPIQEQQSIFQSYKPAPVKQSTSVTIEKSIEPEIKINEGFSSGITQLTDENGGYIY